MPSEPHPDLQWFGPEPPPPACLECGGPLEPELAGEGWLICEDCFERLESEERGRSDD